jgi:hypothetical protein
MTKAPFDEFRERSRTDIKRTPAQEYLDCELRRFHEPDDGTPEPAGQPKGEAA